MSFEIKVDLEAVHLNELADVFAEAGPFFEGKIFEDIFNDFLEGTGAPCPQLLHAIRDRFNQQINLAEITSSTFRLKLLCWSTTGAPRIIQEGNPIRV